MNNLIPSPGDQINTKIDNLLFLLTKLNNSYNNSNIAKTPPTSVTSSIYTVLINDSTLIFNTTTNCTLTLLNASTYPGRVLNIKNISAFNITSASANVIPLNSVGPYSISTPFISGSGKWCTLQSDGINWQIIAGN